MGFYAYKSEFEQKLGLKKSDFEQIVRKKKEKKKNSVMSPKILKSSFDKKNPSGSMVG